MIRFLFLLLTLMSFNSCRFIEEEDDNLNDIPLQAGQWRWVYSINEVNQNDSLDLQKKTGQIHSCINSLESMAI